ncbi:short transient receptor potential channel 4 [Trichonephila clavata]|uniref:Short transient receptor potential channel 4 n=1 Tax=Trichonephila clavata TaxID=2740835 RepID=A0A8X6JG97_TRICU|nr:short transient receptor potential channel 4 [Trichonephila clavata]
MFWVIMKISLSGTRNNGESSLKWKDSTLSKLPTEYEELKEQVRSFTVELIDQCRNTDEVELLLKLPGGFDFDTQKTEFPRLQIALDYKQKEFVAQSMVQQVLTGHWLGEFRSWPRLSLLYKTLHILGRLLLFPVLCILLLVIPWVPRLRKYHSPINRFLLSLSSFLFFFMCVCGVNMMNVGQAVRGPPSSGFEPVVVIFSLGHVWSSIRQFWAQGVIRFIRAPWNWYDLCMHFFFISTFIFWLVSLLNLVSDDVNKAKMERKLWYKYDPTLVHEGLYAIASVLAAGKLGYYCLQSSRLGPLQVSMGKMAIQIGLFLVLFFLIITAFSMPLTRMYAYYAGMVRNLPGGKTASHQSTFTT